MCGEPPPHTSRYTQARRLFADGHVDCNGLLRRLPSPGELENDHHDSSGDSGSSDGHDSSRAVGSLKREVAKLFESESDEEQNQRGVKRAKVKADVFRPMPIRIPTTPIKAKPLATPPDWSAYIVSSDSESAATSRPPQPAVHPSKPRPKPQNKRALSIADGTSAAPDVKGKGKAKAEPVKVSNFIDLAMLCKRSMLTLGPI